MRKRNCAACVSETTPGPGQYRRAPLALSATVMGFIWERPVDTEPYAAYLPLQDSIGAGSGEPTASTARPKGRRLGSRWRAQSTSRGRPRSALQRQSVLRSQGSCSGPIRDGATPSERRDRHQRRRRDLRRLPADLLQSAGRVGRPRPRRVSSTTTRPQGRPQNISGSALIRRGGEGSNSGPYVVASDWHDRRALWTTCPPTKPGARACTQKKIAGPSLAAAGDELINAYERLRAAVLGAEPISSSGLATMRREGMASWVKAAHETLVLTPSVPALHRPPAPGDAVRNELTLLLASLVVTLRTEATSA